jgi:hypothetical protein
MISNEPSRPRVADQDDCGFGAVTGHRVCGGKASDVPTCHMRLAHAFWASVHKSKLAFLAEFIALA